MNNDKNYYDDEIDYQSIKGNIDDVPYYAISGDDTHYRILPFYSYETLVTLEREDDSRVKVQKGDLYDYYDIYNYNEELIHKANTSNEDDETDENLTESIEDYPYANKYKVGSKVRFYHGGRQLSKEIATITGYDSDGLYTYVWDSGEKSHGGGDVNFVLVGTEDNEDDPYDGPYEYEVKESLTEAYINDKITNEEQAAILKIFDREQKHIVISSKAVPEVYKGDALYTFVVECDNSNAMYMGWIRDSLQKYCEPKNIGFETESNDNGFYGRNYIFYKYPDEPIDESLGGPHIKNPVVEVRKDIAREKAKLSGQKPYENFGQVEVRKLKDKYSDYQYGANNEVFKLIDDFDDWCMTYTGNKNESLEDTTHNSCPSDKHVELYASKGKPVNELFYQRNFSTVPLVDKFDFVNQRSNGLPGIQPMNKFIQALNDIKLDKFKVRTSRFGTNISYADIKDEWMDINRNGWTIYKEWDSSLQGFNQIYLCVKNTSEKNKEVTEGKEAMGKVSTNCAYCGSINKVNVIFPAHNKPFNTIDYVCTKCRKRNKLTDEHKYNKDGTLKESTNPLQDYETVIFENTACRERRPTRPGEAKNDIRKEVFSATSDLDAMQYVISLLGDYEKEEVQEEYPDVESCNEYFQYKDWGDGSPFAIYIKQNNKYLYDSGTTVDELVNEYDSEDDNDNEVVATYYFGYVGGSAGNYYDGAKFQIIEQDGEYIAKIDDEFYTEYDTYFTEEEAYNAAIKAITPDDGSELIVDKNSDRVEIQCHDEDRENLDENTSAKVNRDKKPLKEDKELIWEIIFHLPYYDVGDSFEDDDMQFTKIKVRANSEEDALQYAQQYIRSKNKSKSYKIWEGAEIYSVTPLVES